MLGHGFEGLVPVEAVCPLEPDWLPLLLVDDVELVELLLVAAKARPTEETAAMSEMASME